MELDLEFDLYDCDLNNVIASNQPGSMFAHQNAYYDYYDFEDDEDDALGTVFEYIVIKFYVEFNSYYFQFRAYLPNINELI